MPLLRLLVVALALVSCAEAAGKDPNNGGGANHWKRDMQSLRNEPKQMLMIRTDLVVEPGKDKIMLALYLKEDHVSEKKGCPETSSQFSSPANALPDATSSDVRTISGDFSSIDNADTDFKHVFTAAFDLSQISATNMNKMFLVCFYDSSEKEVLALRGTSTDEGMQILVTDLLLSKRSATPTADGTTFKGLKSGTMIISSLVYKSGRSGTAARPGDRFYIVDTDTAGSTYNTKLKDFNRCDTFLDNSRDVGAATSQLAALANLATGSKPIVFDLSAVTAASTNKVFRVCLKCTSCGVLHDIDMTGAFHKIFVTDLQNSAESTQVQQSTFDFESARSATTAFIATDRFLFTHVDNPCPPTKDLWPAADGTVLAGENPSVRSSSVAIGGTDISTARAMTFNFAAVSPMNTNSLYRLCLYRPGVIETTVPEIFDLSDAVGPVFVTDLIMQQKASKPLAAQDVTFVSAASATLIEAGAKRTAPRFNATDAFVFIEFNPSAAAMALGGPKGCPAMAGALLAKSTTRSNAQLLGLEDISESKTAPVQFDFDGIGEAASNNKANRRYMLCMRQNPGPGRSAVPEWDNLAFDLTYALGYMFVTDLNIFAFHTSSVRSKQFITQRITASKMRVASTMSGKGAVFAASDVLLFVSDSLPCPNFWGAANLYGQLQDTWSAAKSTTQSTAIALGQTTLSAKEGIYEHDEGHDLTFDFSSIDNANTNTFYRTCLRLGNTGYSYEVTNVVGKLFVTGWSMDKIRLFPKAAQSLTITETSVEATSDRFFDPFDDALGFFLASCPTSHADWVTKATAGFPTNYSSSVQAMGVESLTAGKLYTFDFTVEDSTKLNKDYHLCYMDKSMTSDRSNYRQDLQVYNTGEMVMLTSFELDRDAVYIGNNQKLLIYTRDNYPFQIVANKAVDQVALYKSAGRTFNSKCPVQNSALTAGPGIYHSNKVAKDAESFVQLDTSAITVVNTNIKYRLCLYDASINWVIDTGVEVTIKTGWSLSLTELEPLATQTVKLFELVRSKDWAGTFDLTKTPPDRTIYDEEMPNKPFVFREFDAVRLCNPACPPVKSAAGNWAAQIADWTDNYKNPAVSNYCSDAVKFKEIGYELANEKLSMDLRSGKEVTFAFTNIQTHRMQQTYKLCYLHTDTVAREGLIVVDTTADVFLKSGWSVDEMVAIPSPTTNLTVTHVSLTFNPAADKLALFANGCPASGTAWNVETAAGTMKTATTDKPIPTNLHRVAFYLDFTGANAALYNKDWSLCALASAVVIDTHVKVYVTGWKLTSKNSRISPSAGITLTITESMHTDLDQERDQLLFTPRVCPTFAGWAAEVAKADTSDAPAPGPVQMNAGHDVTFDFSTIDRTAYNGRTFRMCFRDFSASTVADTGVTVVMSGWSVVNAPYSFVPAVGQKITLASATALGLNTKLTWIDDDECPATLADINTMVTAQLKTSTQVALSVQADADAMSTFAGFEVTFSFAATTSFGKRLILCVAHTNGDIETTGLYMLLNKQGWVVGNKGETKIHVRSQANQAITLSYNGADPLHADNDRLAFFANSCPSFADWNSWSGTYIPWSETNYGTDQVFLGSNNLHPPGRTYVFNFENVTSAHATDPVITLSLCLFKSGESAVADTGIKAIVSSFKLFDAVVAATEVLVDKMLAPTAEETIGIVLPIRIQPSRDKFAFFKGRTCPTDLAAWNDTPQNERSAKTKETLKVMDPTYIAAINTDFIEVGTKVSPKFDLSSISAANMNTDYILCLILLRGTRRMLASDDSAATAVRGANADRRRLSTTTFVDTGIVIFMTGGCSLVGSTSNHFTADNSGYTIYNDCYKNRCLKAGGPYTSFPGACLTGCQWRAGRTKAECDKFCYDSYIVKKSIIHTRKDSAFYQAKLVTVCQYGCDKRCNGLTNAKAVGCLARFTGGLEGACEAQSLRLLR